MVKIRSRDERGKREAGLELHGDRKRRERGDG